MGQSTDAYIFYGIEFDPDEMNGEETKRFFRDLQEEKYDFHDHDPVVIHSHCSGECPIYFVCIRWSFYRAIRGFSTKFDPKDLADLDHKWMDDTLKQFCEKHGLEYSQPQWTLASDWT